jgi:hypothetical protein
MSGACRVSILLRVSGNSGHGVGHVDFQKLKDGQVNIENNELLVEQMGLEPTTSTLRKWIPAKT